MTCFPSHLAPAGCAAQRSAEWSKGGPEADLKQEHLGISVGRQLFSDDSEVPEHTV